MPGRKKEPVSVIQFKGKSHHLTKEEIEKREEGSVKAPADNVKPPKYLTRTQKAEFKEIADQLVALNILTNLDCDVLAMFIVARAEWIRSGKDYEQVRKWAMLKKDEKKPEDQEQKEELGPVLQYAKILEKKADKADEKKKLPPRAFLPFGLDEMTKAANLRDKAFKQAMRCAGELGLTVTSRLRLVIPKKDKEPENKFARFGAG